MCRTIGGSSITLGSVMSGVSSSEAEWLTRLDPIKPPADLVHRPDDPRLGEVVEHWQGDLRALQPGRPVIVGFPQDEGVRRNYGRPGAALAPQEIRRYLYRLTPWDGMHGTDLTINPPLDVGDIHIDGALEDSQHSLAIVIGHLLEAGTIPIILGGGHETAYGHFLGYRMAQKSPGIINLDAHLDVRPLIQGRAHSGSPFRQALEYAPNPLPGHHYVCLGAQP